MPRCAVLMSVVLFVLFPLQSQPELIYRFTPVQDGSGLAIDVRIEFHPRGTDSTLFDLPDRYGGQEQYGGIVGLRTATPGAEIVPTRDRAQVWVRHRRSARVALEYRVTELRAGPVELGDHYQAVIRPGLVHALGNSLLVVPDVPDSLEIEAAWTDTPSGWRFASSFGLGVGPLRTRQTTPWFRHSIWLAGDIRMRETVVNDRPVAVAIHGSWSFDDRDLLRLVRTILQTERDFFDDHSVPFFLVTALEIDGDQDQGGTGRVNSFGLFLSSDRVVDLRLKRLLAHEIFHAWNGDRTEREEPEALLSWFTEGFADYYAKRFLLQAGLIERREYLDDLNANLREYFTSSMRTMSNRSLADGTSGGRDRQRLPYRRGEILAHLLAASGAERGLSLDTTVRSYLMNALRNGGRISNATLLTALEPLLPVQERPMLAQWVEGSVPIDPARPLFLQGADLSVSERHRYYLFGERLAIPSYSVPEASFPPPLAP